MATAFGAVRTAIDSAIPHRRRWPANGKLKRETLEIGSIPEPRRAAINESLRAHPSQGLSLSLVTEDEPDN